MPSSMMALLILAWWEARKPSMVRSEPFRMVILAWDSINMAVASLANVTAARPGRPPDCHCLLAGQSMTGNSFAEKDCLTPILLRQGGFPLTGRPKQPKMLGHCCGMHHEQGKAQADACGEDREAAPAPGIYDHLRQRAAEAGQTAADH